MTNCGNCKNNVNSGIWMNSQFRDCPVWYFCSKKCKNEFVKKKISRIKTNYPKYYEKVMKAKKANRDKMVL